MKYAFYGGLACCLPDNAMPMSFWLLKAEVQSFFWDIVCFCSSFGSFRILKMAWENVSFFWQTWVMKMNYLLPHQIVLKTTIINPAKTKKNILLLICLNWLWIGTFFYSVLFSCGTFKSFLAGLGQKSIVWSMLLCSNCP